MIKTLFPFIFGLMSTCFSMWMRRNLNEIVFSPFDCMLLTLFLLALIFLYLWLSWRRRKMPFQLKLIVHLILYFFTILVVSLVRDAVCFHFLALGASTCMMMNASGACGDSSSSEGVGKLPTPSTSSTWSGSWIEKWFSSEVSSSAPNPGQQQGGEALFQPTDTPPVAGEFKKFVENLPPLQQAEEQPIPSPGNSAGEQIQAVLHFPENPPHLDIVGEPPAPDNQANGPGPHGENPAIPAPAPLGQPSIIRPNMSFELSIRNRILNLENDNTIFLLDMERGGYWNFVRETLNQAPTQHEYNILLECENLDLQIRERKHLCFSLFKQILLEHPALAENAAYNPKEAFVDFFDERRNELNTHGDLSPKQKDLTELKFLDQVAHDLRKCGPNSIYINKSLFFDK